MSRTPIIALIASAALLAVAGARFAGRVLGTAPPAQPRAVAPRGAFSSAEQATIDLFARCSQSVVYVSPRYTRVQRDIFGFLDATEVSATGSGFIWDDQGHIVTNYHVVQDAEKCLVRLADGEEFAAELTGEYPAKDIAVIRINAPKSRLKPIDIGASGELKVGQNVYAIGNPFGYDFSLTTGVVSALGRQIRSITNRTIQDVIQTDAAINPGNSGGPLLDSGGRLIGMNTQIVSPSRASAGIGFAIPVDTINRIVPQLIAGGHVTRPGLGVHVQSGLSRRLGGCVIVGVVKGSNAEAAGLKPATLDRIGRIVLGDVIMAVNKIPTPNEDALMDALDRYNVGDTVKLTILRDGKRIHVSVKLQALQ